MVKTIFFDINEVLRIKSFLFNIDGISGKNIFILISSKSDIYETYVGANSYSQKLNTAMSILDTNGILQDHSKSYEEYTCFIKSDIFFNNEKELFEIQYLFKFILFVVVDSNKTNSELVDNYKKLSFYSVFNFRRWMSSALEMYFIDSDHQFYKEYRVM